MTVIFAMPGAARRKHGSSFRGVALRIRNAADEPPLVLVEDAVMPLAHRQGEANGFHEPVCEPGQLVARTTLDLASGDRPAVNAFAPSP